MQQQPAPEAGTTPYSEDLVLFEEGMASAREKNEPIPAHIAVKHIGLQGKVIGYLHCQQVTRQAQAEAAEANRALVEAARMAAKLLVGISHMSRRLLEEEREACFRDGNALQAALPPEVF